MSKNTGPTKTPDNGIQKPKKMLSLFSLRKLQKKGRKLKKKTGNLIGTVMKNVTDLEDIEETPFPYTQSLLKMMDYTTPITAKLGELYHSYVKPVTTKAINVLTHPYAIPVYSVLGTAYPYTLMKNKEIFDGFARVGLYFGSSWVVFTGIVDSVKDLRSLASSYVLSEEQLLDLVTKAETELNEQESAVALPKELDTQISQLKKDAKKLVDEKNYHGALEKLEQASDILSKERMKANYVKAMNEYQEALTKYSAIKDICENAKKLGDEAETLGNEAEAESDHEEAIPDFNESTKLYKEAMEIDSKDEKKLKEKQLEEQKSKAVLFSKTNAKKNEAKKSVVSTQRELRSQHLKPVVSTRKRPRS